MPKISTFFNYLFGRSKKKRKLDSSPNKRQKPKDKSRKKLELRSSLKKHPRPKRKSSWSDGVEEVLLLDSSEIHFTFLDVETTGFNPASGDKICEIAVIKTINGSIFFNPDAFMMLFCFIFPLKFHTIYVQHINFTIFS